MTRRRLPVVTVALMAVAVLFTVVIPFIGYLFPFIGADDFRYGAALILTPLAFGLCGVLVAMFSRRIDLGARVGWAIISAFTGCLRAAPGPRAGVAVIANGMFWFGLALPFATPRRPTDLGRVRRPVVQHLRLGHHRRHRDRHRHHRNARGTASLLPVEAAIPR